MVGLAVPVRQGPGRVVRRLCGRNKPEVLGKLGRVLLSLQDKQLLLQLADLSFRGRGDQVLQPLVKRGHVAPEPQDRQQPVHQ